LLSLVPSLSFHSSPPLSFRSSFTLLSLFFPS
jgi:hypothetical protein